MEASEIKTKVAKKFESTDFHDLHQRMDEDLEVWEMSPTPANLTEYHSDVLTKTKQHKSDIYVVSNELRVNADNVLSILASSDMQIIIGMAEEKKDMREEIGNLERLLYFMLQQGDERLIRMLLPTLRESSDWHAIVRGWRAARILTYKVDDQVIADYMPIDPRWLVYEVSKNGLLWVGNKTFKSGAAMKSEWDYDGGKEKDNEVIDFWYLEDVEKDGKRNRRIWNAVVYGDKFLKEPEVTELRSMPFSIVPVAMRPPIADSTGNKLKGYGESIFASGRNINAVRNRFTTMWVNHANLMANLPTVNYKAEGGATLPPFYKFNYPGDVIELVMDKNRLEPPPVKDISTTELSLLNWLNSQVQSTILPPFQMEEPPASGTRYAMATEQANKIFNPQLRSLKHFYEDICRLIEEQLIDGGIKLKFQSLLRNEHKEVKVTPVDLKKAHIIEVEFTARTPWSQLDIAQVADMLRRAGVPEGWIWENIYKFQDPKGMADLRAIELFERSPEGAMITAWKALKRQGRKDEADRLEEQIYNLAMSEQWGQGETAPEVPPEAEVGAGE